MDLVVGEPAHATASDRCLAFKVVGPCLREGDDSILVERVDVIYLGNNTIRIDSKLSNLLIDSIPLAYIVQVTDEENSTVYVTWTVTTIGSGREAYVSDIIELEAGLYTAKVMVWSDLEQNFRPLVMQAQQHDLLVV
jgi:hypothetical protein